MSEQQEKTFKEVFKPIVEEIIDEKMVKLSQEDVEDIVKRIIPKIDEIIANRIRQHLHALIDAFKEKIKE